jgi:hypothetical protein
MMFRNMTLRRTLAELGLVYALLAGIITCACPGLLPPRAVAAADLFPAPAVYDVRNYGAVPDEQAGTTFPAALEKIHAEILTYRATHPGDGCTIRIPGGHWYTDVPILWDLEYTRFVGDGADTTILQSTGQFSALILGLRSNPGGKAWTDDHWVDLNGKMSFASSPGKYYGIRTKTDAHAAFWADPFSFSGCASDGANAYWSGVRKLTIDFCIDWPAPPTNSNQNTIDLFSISDGSRWTPFCIRVYGRTYYFEFRLADGKHRGFSFSLPPSMAASGVHRVSFQIDTVAGTAQAFLGDTNANRVQVATNYYGSGGATFDATTNLTFLANEIHPFMIGGVSPNAMGPGGAQNRVDHSFYGLQFSNKCLYANNGAGKPQVRVDGAAVSDSNCFHSVQGDPATIVTLDNPSGPNGPWGGKLVRYVGGVGSSGYGAGYGLFLQSEMQINTTGNLFGQEVHDLTIQTSARSRGWGAALTLTGNFNTQITGVNAFGGWHGIGTLYIGGCYPTFIDRVKVNGYDAGMMLMGQIAQISKVDCGFCGTTAIRFHGTGSIRDIFINSQNHRGRGTIIWHGGESQNQLEIESLRIDNEGYPFPTQGVLVAENGTHGRAMLYCRNWYVGVVGKPGAAAAIALVDNPLNTSISNLGRPFATIGGLLAEGTAYRAMVTTDGPAWQGHVVSQPVVPGDPPILVHLGAGTSNVIVQP